MGRCPTCGARFQHEWCADGEITCPSCGDDVDVDDCRGGVLVASFILALAPHPAGFGRGSALGDLEVLSSLLRDLFAGEVPAHLPHLRIDLDKLLDGAIGGCMNGFASAAPAI